MSAVGIEAPKRPSWYLEKSFCITTPQCLFGLPFGKCWPAHMTSHFRFSPSTHHPIPFPLTLPHLSLPPVFQLVLYPIEHLVFHCWLIKFLHLAPYPCGTRKVQPEPGSKCILEGRRGVETGTAYLTYAAQSTRSGREHEARPDRSGQTGTAWD